MREKTAYHADPEDAKWTIQKEKGTTEDEMAGRHH